MQNRTWINGALSCLIIGGTSLVFAKTDDLKPADEARWRREVLPLPQELVITRVQSLKPVEVGIRGRSGAVGLEQTAVANVVELFREKTGVLPSGKGFEIVIGLMDDEGRLEGNPVQQGDRLKALPNKDQAYVIQPIGENRLLVAALTERGLYYGTCTLSQWLERHLNQETAEIPLANVVDWPDLEERGFWHMPISKIPWLASMKMNRFNIIHNFSVNANGIHPFPAYSEDATVKQDWTPPYEKARLYAAEVVPGPTHMDFWEANCSGYKEAFPQLIGKGESAGNPAAFEVGIVRRAPCASNPELVKVLTAVMTNLASQKAAEVMVWMSEYPALQCECVSCMERGQYVGEVQATLAAWNEAKKSYPDLKLSVFFGRGGSSNAQRPLPPRYPDHEIQQIVKMLPPEVTMRASMGCDGEDGRLLADFAAKGKRISRMDASFLSRVFGSDDVRQGIERVISGQYIGAWTWTPGYYMRDFGILNKKKDHYRACALAEYEWNSKGRTEEEFAEAWAVRQGYSDLRLFEEWVRVIDSSMTRRMTQAWGDTAQQTWLGRLPEEMAVGDFNVDRADTSEQNTTAAQHALAAAEKIGDPALVLASRTLVTYCALETSGYAWMRRDADKTNPDLASQSSHKEIREQFAVALQDYIVARQAEIKELSLGSREKSVLDGGAPLEKLMECLRTGVSKR